MKRILFLPMLLLCANAQSQVTLHNQSASSAVGYLYANHFTDIDTPIKAADDFTVPVGEVWSITQLGIQAYSPNYTVPDSTLVEIFDNNNGYPGAIVYSEVLQFNACTFISGITWATIDIASQPLSEGTYWVSLMGYTLESNIWTWNLVTGNHGNVGVYMDPNGYAGPVQSSWITFSDANLSETGMNFEVVGTKGFATIANLEKDQIQIYPNPVSSECTIVLSDNVLSFELLDLNGSIVQTVSKSVSNQYDLSFLESGVYFVRWNDNGHYFQQRIIKN